jgi:hypothetical protein
MNYRFRFGSSAWERWIQDRKAMDRPGLPSRSGEKGCGCAPNSRPGAAGPAFGGKLETVIGAAYFDCAHPVSGAMAVQFVFGGIKFLYLSRSSSLPQKNKLVLR